MMAAVTAPAPPTLQTGQHVNVRNVHIGTLPATIDKADGGAVIVALAVNDDRVTRLVGQDMAVELTSGRGIHRFGGTLSAQSGGGTLTIALSGDVERIQRREFVRVSAGLDVTVRGIDESIGGETATIDVSVNGIAILDKWRLPIGLDVRVELALPDGEPLRALGRVVRQGAEENHKGIRLDSLGRQEEDRLMRFIREREVQALRASRDR
jgi:PilZ domain